MNIKYKSFYLYDIKTKKVIDNKKVLKDNHIIYTILKKYKIPNYLKKIKIIKNNSIEEADNSLVFFGINENNKILYFYGINYAKNRKIKKTTIFLKMYNLIPKILEIINNDMNNEIINDDFLFSFCILLELSYFIRIGKEIYYKNNETIGLLTLEKKNIIFDNQNIIISFKGKTNVMHEFTCNKIKQKILYDMIKKLYNNKNNNTNFLIVNNKNEKYTVRKLNYKLNKFGITFKDFRIYGVNSIFLKFFYENKIEKNFKDFFNKILIETSKYIGHTPNICKNSYLIEEMYEILEKNFKRINTFKTFENFYLNFIKILKTKWNIK